MTGVDGIENRSWICATVGDGGRREQFYKLGARRNLFPSTKGCCHVEVSHVEVKVTLMLQRKRTSSTNL